MINLFIKINNKSKDGNAISILIKVCNTITEVGDITIASRKVDFTRLTEEQKSKKKNEIVSALFSCKYL